MIVRLGTAASELSRLFAYPRESRSRRHHPTGYKRYTSFKPWLRDEFEYRCAFCLRRELWSEDDKAAFHVEHRLPEDDHPALRLDYTNLIFSCGTCNDFKGTQLDIPDPLKVPFGKHLTVKPDGSIRPRTKTGRVLVKALRLNRASLTEVRRKRLQFLALLLDKEQARRGTKDHPVVLGLIIDHFGYPKDLPDLSRCKVQNQRPEGLADSAFERRKRGELPLIG